jgi:hypothetical protein
MACLPGLAIDTSTIDVSEYRLQVRYVQSAWKETSIPHGYVIRGRVTLRACKDKGGQSGT